VKRVSFDERIFDSVGMFLVYRILTYLDTGVSNGRTSKKVETVARIPLIFSQDKGVSKEDTLVTRIVHAKGESANLVGTQGSDPVLDEHGNAAAQAWSETARSHHGDIHVLSSEGEFRGGAHGSSCSCSGCEAKYSKYGADVMLASGFL
jgi:hypothetical protein